MTEKQTQRKNRGKRQTVTLAKPKRHRGRLEPKGARIELYPDQVERARRHGEIEE